MSAAGPPTPPPTSAVEIADEAREAALEAAAAAAASKDTIGSAPPTAPETDAIHAPAEPASTEPAATAPVGSSATDSVIPGDGAQPPSSTASSTISEFITQSIIPTIVAASADKNWQEVIRIAEDAEIQVGFMDLKCSLSLTLLLSAGTNLRRQNNHRSPIALGILNRGRAVRQFDLLHVLPV